MTETAEAMGGRQVGLEENRTTGKQEQIYIYIYSVQDCESQECTAEGIPEIPTPERFVDFRLLILNLNILG